MLNTSQTPSLLSCAQQTYLDLVLNSYIKGIKEKAPKSYPLFHNTMSHSFLANILTPQTPIKEINPLVLLT